MTNLPGRCMGCGADVWYRGRLSWWAATGGAIWRNRDGKAHTCPVANGGLERAETPSSLTKC